MGRQVEKIRSHKFAPTNYGNATNVRNKLQDADDKCNQADPTSKYPITIELRKQDELINTLNLEFAELEAKLVKVLRPASTGSKTQDISNNSNSPLADLLRTHNTKLEHLFQRIQEVSDRIEVDYE